MHHNRITIHLMFVFSLRLKTTNNLPHIHKSRIHTVNPAANVQMDFRITPILNIQSTLAHDNSTCLSPSCTPLHCFVLIVVAPVCISNIEISVLNIKVEVEWYVLHNKKIIIIKIGTTSNVVH